MSHRLHPMARCSPKDYSLEPGFPWLRPFNTAKVIRTIASSPNVLSSVKNSIVLSTKSPPFEGREIYHKLLSQIVKLQYKVFILTF